MSVCSNFVLVLLLVLVVGKETLRKKLEDEYENDDEDESNGEDKDFNDY